MILAVAFRLCATGLAPGELRDAQARILQSLASEPSWGVRRHAMHCAVTLARQLRLAGLAWPELAQCGVALVRSTPFLQRGPLWLCLAPATPRLLS